MRREKPHAGDLLTAGRLLATPLFAGVFAAALHGALNGWIAGLLFAAVCASDYFDGRLARRAGRASARGRIMDSVADIVFLLTALSVAVAAGRAPWWVPAAVAASFAYYAVDSWVLTRHEARRTLIASRVGHIGGVCNYILVGVLVFNDGCGLRVLGPHFLAVLFYLVPLYSAAAIATRFNLRRGATAARARAS